MSRKTATLNLRVSPEVKKALEMVATLERRSLTGLVEWLVTQHCEQHSIHLATVAKDLASASAHRIASPRLGS
jgi:uncharacterized protein (DUF1778 family)